MNIYDEYRVMDQEKQILRDLLARFKQESHDPRPLEFVGDDENHSFYHHHIDKNTTISIINYRSRGKYHIRLRRWCGRGFLVNWKTESGWDERVSLAQSFSRNDGLDWIRKHIDSLSRIAVSLSVVRL